MIIARPKRINECYRTLRNNYVIRKVPKIQIYLYAYVYANLLRYAYVNQYHNIISNYNPSKLSDHL